MDVNPTAVVFLQSLIFLLQSPKQRRRDRLLPPPMAGCAAAQVSAPPTTPTTGQGIPLLTHTPCYSAATAASHHSRTSEPSCSSPRGLPLPRLPRLRIVPFLGLVVVHRRGALRGVWSTWSRNDFDRKSSVRGEADSWVHGHTPVFFVICQASRFVRPVGPQIFQDEESFIRLAEKMAYQ